MPAVEYLRVRKAIQYTGGNGAEVSAFANVPIVSDSGTVLELGDPGTGWVSLAFSLGDYFEDTANVRWAAADFPSRNITKAAALADTNTVYDPTALTARVTALEAKPTGTSDIVSVQVPLLLLGGSADRVVTWARPFSSANYNISFALDSNTIGRITPTVKAGTKTATGVTITITAGLAVTVAGVVHVLGTT